MTTGEIAKRVKFAEEIHTNKQLSDMIQRTLKEERAEQIKEYLLEEPERFFNSLVIATYGGKPNWFQVAVKPMAGADVSEAEEIRGEISQLAPTASESLGLLRLTGEEVMFALDGQHRLAGIKLAVKTDERLAREPLSVLLVAHRTDQAGLRRTRRLFTTLNKTAVPVSKSEIIALDENDAAAITVRRLVEEEAWFSGKRIAFIASTNIRPSNHESLTTIGNLYDVIKVLILRGVDRAARQDFLRRRPDDAGLEKMRADVIRFFELAADHMPELRQYFRSSKPEQVIRKYRNSKGGSLVFRPIGLLTLAELVASLSRQIGVARAIRQAARLPRALEEPPLRNVIWNPATRKIMAGNRVFMRKLFAYMLDPGKRPPKKLLLKYREIVDDESVVLPRL
jgi:DNA sulfur modification protein DndB